LHLPQIVLDEVANKYRKDLEASKSKIESELAKIEKRTQRQFESPLPEIETMVVEYRDNLQARLDAVGAKYLNYPRTSHADLVRRELEGTKPFKENGAGYRDALIWETVLELASDGDDPVAFISENKKDFSDNGKLHPELVAHLDSLSEQHSEVHYFADLESFVEQKIKPVLEALDTIRKALSTNEYEALNLEKFLLEEMVKKAQWPEMDPRDFGLSLVYANPTVVAINEVDELEVTDVRRLSSGDLLISFTARIACELNFLVNEADAVRRRHNIILRISIVFSENTRAVTATEILDVAPLIDSNVRGTPMFGQAMAYSAARKLASVVENVTARQRETSTALATALDSLQQQQLVMVKAALFARQQENARILSSLLTSLTDSPLAHFQASLLKDLNPMSTIQDLFATIEQGTLPDTNSEEE
jgi:hypothetical protein